MAPFLNYLCIAVCLVFLLPVNIQAADPDTINSPLDLNIKVGITNNGFSFVPAFTLGEPATSLDIILKWRRFSIEPQFQYSLTGKPWTFIFLYRYKIINDGWYQLSAGTHFPALAFVYDDSAFAGSNGNRPIVDRVLAAEIINTFIVSPRLSFSLLYLRSRGVQTESFRNGHFLSLSPVFSPIAISHGFQLNLFPQVFYLRLDDRDGFYISGSLLAEKRNFPLSLGSTFYKTFDNEIGGKDFNWNLSLFYTFRKTYHSR
jgi:hypothetical protein